MNRRNSMSGRLSLSTTNLSNPIAESTHINGSSVHTKLPWSGKLNSPAISTDIVQKKTPKIQMSPINKIDPRMYVDVHSKGLASRIVKYHENSGRLNRSLSTGNLYNKPGQFPVVHLKKKEITYKPNKNQSISMVRIAPPDKSVFQANTRSSILRTGSIVPTVSLQRGKEQISGENRPILHPAGNDIAPTRSVLDALREISRKRINSDELDCGDNIKKYCKESDEISGYIRPTSTFNSSMSKRQREGPSPPNSLTSTSPEQLSRKRLCSRNNDVTSSLSSSLMMVTPKRKFDDIQSHRSAEVTKTDSPTPPKSKQQCYETRYIPLQKIEAVIKDQITPLPPTPAVETMKQIETLITPKEQKLQAGTEKPKPKLTLFNKNYDDASVEKVVNDFGSKFGESDLPGVTFVKPKSNSQVSSGTNPLIERTKKSKLALMLSGLSGELNEDDLDGELKRSNEIKDLAKETSTTHIVSPLISTTSSASISFETKTTASTTTIPTVSAVTQSNREEQNSTSASTMTTVTFSKVATSTPMTPATTIASTTSTSTTISTKASSPMPVTKGPIADNSTSTSAPQRIVSTGFTFGPSKITSNTSSASNVSESAKIKTTSTLSTEKPNLTFSTNNAPLTSAQSVVTFSFGKTSAHALSSTSINTTQSNFGPPVTSANLASTLLGTTMSTSPNFNSLPKPALDFKSLRTGQTSNIPSFGIASGNQSSATLVSTSSLATISSEGNQLGSFNAPQKTISAFSSNSNPNPNFTSANSTFTSTAKSALSLAADNSKSPNNVFQANSSGGFSFKPPNMSPSNTSASSSNAPFTFSSTLSQKDITTTSSGFSFSASTPSRAGGFSFAPSSTVSASSKPVTSAPAFSFGGNISKPASGFTLSETSSDNKTQNLPAMPAPLTFGVHAQSSGTTNSTFVSNSSDNKPNPFSFGGAQTQKPATVTDGMMESNKNGSKPNAFVFGNPSSSQAAATTTAFNTTPVTSGHSVFGAPASTTSSIFGAPATTKSSAFSAPSASTGTIFGTLAATTSSIPASSFAISKTTSNSVFGAPTTIQGFPASTANSSSAFSSPITENKSAPFVFGTSTAGNNISSATKSFSFGTNTSTPAPSGGFSFNGLNAPENKNVFAAPSSSSQTFSFGATQSYNNDGKALFGSTSSNNNLAAGSSFGPSQGQPKSFNFTAGPNNSVATNPFPASTTTKSDTPFTFGAPSQQQSTINNNNSSQTFAFGANSSNTSFAFNASSTPTGGASDSNKTFTFGGNPSNAFGGTSSPVFNFSAGANTNTTNSATPNPFNVQPSSSSTTTAGDRVIRKVARRVPK